MWNPLSFEAEVSISEQQKPFVTLRPEDYLLDEVQRDATLGTGEAKEKEGLSLTTSTKYDRGVGGLFYLLFIVHSPFLTARELLASREKRADRALIGSIQDVVFPSGVVAHATQALKINLPQIGGIPLLFSIIEKRPAHEMIISLPIIASLIYQAPENKAEFMKMDGYGAGLLPFRFLRFLSSLQMCSHFQF
jgi:hypothetical protein